MVHCHSTRLTSHDLFHTIFLYRLQRLLVDRFNHDTIGMAGHHQSLCIYTSCDDILILSEILFHPGMIVVDEQGRIACGTSTNGLTHKLAG